MSRITALKIGDLLVPFKDDPDSGFIITQVTGISDVEFSHAEVSYEDLYTIGEGRDITIILSIRPNTSNSDFYAVRRRVSLATPLDKEITLSIYLDGNEGIDGDPYAQTICKVRNVSGSFSDEIPAITLDLESIYTCLIRFDKKEISRLPFGTEAHIPDVTHDYAPVRATIHLIPQLAAWYRIYVSSNWISINTSILKSNYNISSVPNGSTIYICSDEADGLLTTDFGVFLRRPGQADLNIETACDVGPGGFMFSPNEPMVVKAMKIPSSLSGEYIDLEVYPRLSGV